MKYSIAPEVVQLFPSFMRGVVVARGIDNTGYSEQIAALLREAENKVRQDTTLTEITTHPRIANWRNAFNLFGVKPGKFPPSIEALVRRVRKGDSIPHINDMVAFCNYISLNYMIPVGAHALDDCDGDMYIRVSDGSEPFTPIGSNEVEHPDAGEIILADNSRALTRRWIWRQAEATKAAESTKDIEINIDGLAPVTRDEIEGTTQTVMELIRKHFHPRSLTYLLLEANNPVIEFEV